ncbi:hypothetical protein BDW59DRAFT_151992 [Aspergillus cavernicola]|uniref:Uncharacterized protein n=1 Tax=Aspergillus cavernicola TaxID=176166 RepID=A0ABR4HSQ2_9EURO
MPSIKPVLPPLKTPNNITFPSELHTDSSAGSKNEDSSSTPITPPAAYTEFLKAFTPIFSSPTSADGVDFSKYRLDRHNLHSPRSQPSSAVSGSFNFNEPARSATISLPPPTPFVPPHGRRELSNLRRLRIPPALRYSPTSAEPPRSAGPRSAGPRSATSARSPYTPSDWRLRYLDAPRSANPRISNHKMSIRHVITHTITYKTTELDAPPKGKRRKQNHESNESK